MWTLRPANSRGHAHYGWLDTHHTFSFSNYYDPKFMGFGPLRVINDDRVAGGGGFPPHPHANMEILTYVVEGALEHRDTTGGGGIIRPGDVQHMTAGTGVRHSEFNASESDGVRFLQIWIVPEKNGKEPRYRQTHFDLDSRRDAFKRVASSDGAEGSLPVGQDVNVFASVVGKDVALRQEVAAGRGVWLQMVTGELALHNAGETLVLKEGDGAFTRSAESVEVTGRADVSELLMFDVGSLPQAGD